MQRELFEVLGSSTEAAGRGKEESGFFDHFRITLRLDHLLIIGILALVLYVLVFSFGVEKGKGYAIQEIKAEQLRQEQISRELVQAKKPEESPSRPQEEDSPARPEATEALGPPTEEPPLSQPSRIDGKYTIQIIAFSDRKRADAEVGRLKQLGYESFIIPGGKFFQVCVDGFGSVKEAREKLTRLKAEGLAPSDAYIRPLTGPILL